MHKQTLISTTHARHITQNIRSCPQFLYRDYNAHPQILGSKLIFKEKTFW